MSNNQVCAIVIASVDYLRGRRRTKSDPPRMGQCSERASPRILDSVTNSLTAFNQSSARTHSVPNLTDEPTDRLDPITEFFHTTRTARHYIKSTQVHDLVVTKPRNLISLRINFYGSILRPDYTRPYWRTDVRSIREQQGRFGS